MGSALLVLNAGSSSVKFTVYAVGMASALSEVGRGQVEEIGCRESFFEATTPRAEGTRRRSLGHADHAAAVREILAWVEAHESGLELRAVGHRVVHGGGRFAAPVRVDDDVLAALDEFVPLAPLHQPHNLMGIRAVRAHRNDLPQVACFDTAFHQTQDPLATRFALPPEWTERGIRRYGFHGLSYEYVASQLNSLDPHLAEARVIVLHLGNGASLCALRAGRSVATTMGFTPLDGVPMGTRPGSLDPGVLLHLVQHYGMDAPALEALLNHHSGLLGVSGVSSDMRELLASDDPRARLAIDLFVYRVGREIGSLAAALGGLDALVFTAGIGENAAPIRERICTEAAWLGARLDAEANARGAARISAHGSAVSLWVVPTDENRMIARHTLALLGLR